MKPSLLKLLSTFAVLLISAVNTLNLYASTPSPRMLPYEPYVCESDWTSWEVRVDAQPGFTYNWNLTDPTVLGALELSMDNTRVRFSTPETLPTYVNVFLAVQAIDAAGCPSIPTVVTLVMVPQMDIPVVDEDTTCVNRNYRIEQFQSGRIDRYEWDFGTIAEEITPGESEEGDPFFIKFTEAGEHTLSVDVIDTFGCVSTQFYDYVVYDAPPPPNIPPCAYIDANTILFEWTTAPGFAYEMIVDNAPTTATLDEGANSLLVTDISPGQNVIITVTATGTSPAPCDVSTQMQRCRSCLNTSANFDQILRKNYCLGEPGNFATQLIAEVTNNLGQEVDPAEGSWVTTIPGTSTPVVGLTMIGGVPHFDPTNLPAGVYDLFYVYNHPTDNCPWSFPVTFNIFERPEPASFSATSFSDYRQICSDQELTVNFARLSGQQVRISHTTDDVTGGVMGAFESRTTQVYTFPNEEKSYEIYVQYEFTNCDPIIDTLRVDVIEKPELEVLCGLPQPTSIDLEWNTIIGSDSYEIYLDNGLIENIMGTNTRIDGLEVDREYEIIVVAGVPTCGLISDTITCSTGGCVPPRVDLTNLDDPICYNPSQGPVLLDVDIQSSKPMVTGDYYWDTPLVDQDNFFVPQQGQEIYFFDIIYTEGACMDTIKDVQVSILEEPIPDLSVNLPNPICISEQTRITSGFAAVDPTMITYLPVWPDNVNATGVGPGEFLLNFDQPGTYVIDFSILNGTCTGPTESLSLEVVSKPDIKIDCAAPEAAGLNVFWTNVEGTPGYEIYLNNDLQEMLTDTSTSITGLDVDTEYEIIVISLDASCGLVSDTTKCSTGACIDPMVDLSNLTDPFCYEEGQTINLDVEISSSKPGVTGSYTYDSPLVDLDNEFTPDPGQEVYTFDILYDEGACKDTVFAVEVNALAKAIPDLSLNVDNPFCITEDVLLTSNYTVVDPTQITYLPVAPDEVTITDMGSGTFDLEFAEAGVYQLEFSIDNGVCLGDVETLTLDVQPAIEAPNVTCIQEIGGITLEWTSQPCVNTYDILIDGVSVASTSDLTYTIDLLNAGVSYDWTVVAVSNCACADNAFTDSCEPLPCPDINIITTNIDTCFNPTLEPFMMPIDITESTLLPPGVGSWDGLLINGNGMVDLSQAPFDDTFTLTYTHRQGNCAWTEMVDINLLNPPFINLIETFPPSCEDDSLGTVIVSVSDGTPDYLFSVNGSEFQSDPVFASAVEVGFVNVEVVDAVGCSTQDISEVDAYMDNPTLSVDGPELVIEANDAIFSINTNVDPMSITNIIWYLDEVQMAEGVDQMSFTLTDVTTAGVISVDVFYGDDCSLTEDKEFAVNDLQSIYIPNTIDLTGSGFAPDNEWRAYVKGDQVFFTSVLVFDRWGNKVYDFENLTMDYFKDFLIWDGNFGSELAEQGVYTYVMELVIEGRPEIKRGTITVLR